MAQIIYNNIPFEATDLTDQDSNFTIGKFMTAWSQVESLCGFLFRTLSDIDHEIASTIFDRIGVKEQIEIVTELIHSIENEQCRNDAINAMSEVENLSKSRNKIVHAGWGLFDGERARFWHGITNARFEEIVRETDKGKADRKRFISTITDITNLIDRCISVREALERINDVALDERRKPWSMPGADLRR